MARGAIVRAYLGQPGSGKTYMMSAMADEWRAAHPEGRLFSTYELKVDGCELTSPPHDGGVPITECRDGLLLIDEAALMFDSRLFQSVPTDLLHMLMQHRKYRLDLWWSTQHLEYVDKRLRLITREAFRCGSFAQVPLVGGFFARIQNGVGGSSGGGGFRFMRRSGKRDALYDTYEIVQRAAYLSKRSGVVASKPSGRVGGEPGDAVADGVGR